MSRRFEELAWEPTPIGDVSLRRRQDPVTDVDIFEVKLGDEYLMSSQFTVAEIALAELGLGWLERRGTPRTGWEVVVGGLGLGYTADALLADDRVRQLIVVDALAPVMTGTGASCSRSSRRLTTDPRCRLELGDFFTMSQGVGFDPETPDRRFDAVLVDIDHSPRHQLGAGNADFSPSPVSVGWPRLAFGGVFGLWSNDPPDGLPRRLERSVHRGRRRGRRLPNPLQQRQATNTVYLASGTKTA